MIAQNDKPTDRLRVSGQHEPKPRPHPPDDEPQPIALYQLSCGEHFAEPVFFGLVVAGDQHVIVRGGRIQLVAHFGDVAAEALDRFHTQMTGRFDARDRQCGDADARELNKQLEHPGHREKPGRFRGTLEVSLALLLQLFQLDKHCPASRRQIVAQVAAKDDLLPIARPVRRGDLDGRQIAEAALRFGRELAN